MKSRVASLDVSAVDYSRPLEPELEQLIEATAARLQAAEAVDFEDLIATHPEYADQLRELLPTVEMLVRMGEAPVEAPTNCAPGNGAPHALPYQQLGDFRLIRELGRGGMGTVYEAEQLSMGRHVALKVLPFAALADDKSLQRFRNEVRAAAALDHPHIVSVYSVGEERGVHFYAMQLIRGQTLAQMIDELRTTHRAHPLPWGEDQSEGSSSIAPKTDSAASLAPSTQQDEQAHVSTGIDSRHAKEYFCSAARFGVQAAEALQHAHDLGVLHRDIKPGNLMLDTDAQIYITDFGFARIETDAALTMTGDVIGTLRYMAPEQALAQRVVIDHRADVYSLGATIYELLTLEPAFAETDRSELLKQIAFEEPRRLRKLDRRIPAELETIVLKAMAKSRDERYQSAQRLSDDLQAFLDCRPIQAKLPTWRYRIVKWTRRHRGTTVAGAIVVLLLLIFTTAVVADRWRQDREATRFVSHSLVAARNALRNDDVKQTVLRLAEAQSRIDANRLNSGELINDLTELRRESERYAQFNMLVQKARDQRSEEPSLSSVDGTGVLYSQDRKGPLTSAEQALELYHVMDTPDWLGSLHDVGLPKAHVDRIVEAVYELLLLRADHLTRWERNRQPQVAVRYLEKATSFHTPTRGYYWLLANCYHFMGDQVREKSLRETALKTAPHDAAELFYINNDRLWGTASDGKDYPKYSFEESIRDHREMLRLDPTYFNGLFFMACRLSDQGRHAESLIAWYGCTSLRPNDSLVLSNRGIEHAFLGHYDEAIADFREAIKWKPHQASLHCHLGQALLKYGQTNQAIDEFRQAVSLDQDNGEAHVQLADMLEVKGSLEEAITEYREAAAAFRKRLGLNADDAAAERGLAWVLAMYPDSELRDPHESLELAKKAVERLPENQAAWKLLGVANYRMGNWQNSIDVLRKEIELGDDEGFQRFLLAMAEWQLGNHQAASTSYAKAEEWMEQNAADAATLRVRQEATELIRPADAAVQ